MTRLHRWLWRASYAFTMVWVTKCSLSTGYRRADEAMYVRPDWATLAPDKLARERGAMYTNAR